jgi:hypothetical protein
MAGMNPPERKLSIHTSVHLANEINQDPYNVEIMTIFSLP